MAGQSDRLAESIDGIGLKYIPIPKGIFKRL